MCWLEYCRSGQATAVLVVKGKSIKRFRHRRNPAYVAFVRTMPCLVCWRMPAEAAHVRSRGAGGNDVGNVVPLCHEHHMEQHTIGIRSFEQRHHVELAVVASALEQVWTHEPVSEQPNETACRGRPVHRNEHLGPA